MDNYNYIVSCIIALGALGLFFMLPRFLRVGFPRFGGLLALVALVGLFGAMLINAGETRVGEHYWFAIFGAIAIGCSVMMICQKRALYAALYFVLTALAVAGLILLQMGEFLALALVIVYSGGIVVIYIFALMLSQQQDLTECDTDTRSPFWAVLIGFFLLGSFLRILFQLSENAPPDAAEGAAPSANLTGSAQALGRELFDKHVVALEVAGIILLIAAVGAIALLKAPKVKESQEQNIY